MPIYMDRHDVTEPITPEDVAQIHQQDVKIQHEYNCNVLTYWFDQKRNKVFCLVEAPDKESMLAMHKHSHGSVPNELIEVQEDILESFLGRIEKPRKPGDENLYEDADSASRIIMVIGLKRSSLEVPYSNELNTAMQTFGLDAIEVLGDFDGTVVKQNTDNFLVSFKSASNAVSGALKIQSLFNELIGSNENTNIHLKIGISTGIPITDKAKLFESTITLAERMCNMVKEQIVVSFEVKNQYINEKLSVFTDNEFVHALNPADEKFLNLVMDNIEKTWNNPNLNVDDFGKQLGYSKSQLYRKMISLTGKSPNTLIKEYRLSKALMLLGEQKGNISEIAFETGFNSPAYFSKCFSESYGILPSDYIKRIT
jgi:AraC-like DNA-binding protein